MARPQKCRCICSIPKTEGFLPVGRPHSATVQLGYDEYEVVRLLDYENLSQQQCAEKMAISRPTVTRIYNLARRKIADALVNGKRIAIYGGDVQVCPRMKPECRDNPHCCHRQSK